MANYTRTAIKGASIFFIMSLFAGFMGYLIRLVLARNLSQADYGLFYAVFAFFGMLSLLRDMGLGQASIKYIAEFNIKKKYDLIKGSIIITFLSQFLVSLVIFGIVVIFSRQTAIYFFHTQDAVIVMLLLAFMFLLTPFEKIISFTFQGFKRFDFNSLIEFIRMSAVLVFIFLAFKYNISIIIPALAYIFAYVFEILFFSPFFVKTFPTFFKVKAHLTKPLFKKLYLFGIPVIIGLFGSMIITYVDTLTVTYFRTLEEVALYQVAMPTAKLLLYFTTAVSMVVLPISSELWAKNLKKKLILGVNLLYRYSFVFIIPLALLMFTFPEIIIKVLFGSKYIVTYLPLHIGGLYIEASASTVLQILSISGIVYTVAYINSNVLSGIGKPKENTKIILTAAILNLILDIILVPLWGIIGAALATLLSYFAMLIFTVAKVKKFVDVHAPWEHWIKTLIAAIVFVIVMAYMKSIINIFGDLVEMIIVGIVGGIIYLVLLILLKVVDVKEVLSIVKYAMKK